MKKIILLLGLTSGLLASNVINAGGWSAWYPVHLVYVHSNGNIHFQLNPVSSHFNPENCTSPSWFIVKSDNKAIDRIYQMLLTAKASGKKVRPHVYSCFDNKPLVHSMMIWD